MLCKFNINCYAFTFVSTEGRCDLKNYEQAVTLIEYDDTVISGIIGPPLSQNHSLIPGHQGM